MRRNAPKNMKSMNILDENLIDDPALDRYITEVAPVVKRFEEAFDQGVCVPVLIDPLDEVNMNEIAAEKGAKYYDLESVSKEEYEPFARSLANHGSYIFDNIDKISEGPQKEYFVELVRFILKREDDFPVSEKVYVDFSYKRIGARCAAIPDYLAGKSTNALYLPIPAPGTPTAEEG